MIQAKLSIINIGDELLIGQVINTNASKMGAMLRQQGYNVTDVLSVSDTREGILDALAYTLPKSDIVLISGGLGPTKDDITKTVLCDYFNTSLEYNAEAYANVERIFSHRGLILNASNKAQAMLPKACIPLPNSCGTAFGMWFNTPQGKVVVSMPGVPYEMLEMMQHQVLPRLHQQFKPQAYFQHTLMTQGIGESVIAEQIAHIEDAMPSNMQLAYLPCPGMVRLRLSAQALHIEDIKKQVLTTAQKIESVLGKAHVFAYNDKTLEEVVHETLLSKGATLATAESCTGGAIAARLTALAGASQYFLGSILSYHNIVKTQLLSVSPDLLQKHGAVSPQVVEAMLLGIQNQIQSDYAIAVSGIAGPGGGTDSKAVGTTYIGVLSPQRISIERFQFGAHRGRNIERSVLSALNMLRLALDDTKQ